MTQHELPEPDDKATGAVEGDFQVLRRSLQEDIAAATPTPGGNALIALCGLPGTGKSHFAAELRRRIPCLVLGSDRLRKVLVAQPRYTRKEHARVFRAAHALLESLLREGYPVVFDATNLTERAREPLRQIAARVGVPLALVQFDAPPALVRERLARRSRGEVDDTWSDADWRIYCRLYPGHEPVSQPHFRVDSSRSIGPVVEELAGWLEGIALDAPDQAERLPGEA